MERENVCCVSHLTPVTVHVKFLYTNFNQSMAVFLYKGCLLSSLICI